MNASHQAASMPTSRVTASVRAGKEMAAARRAAEIRITDGAALGPAVAGYVGERPRLETVSGPRLNDHVLQRVRSSADPLSALPTDALVAAGGGLAGLHSQDPPVRCPAQLEHPPWDPVLFVEWLGLSAAQAEVIGRLHGDVELRRAGRAVRSRLVDGDAWCHGDARGDKVVVRPTGGTALIDWERTGLARPEADVAALCGSVLAELLAWATRSPGEPADVVAATRRAVLLAGRAISSVLSGYRRKAAVDLDIDLLAAATGSHLVSRTLALTTYTALDRPARFLLEIGTGLLRYPERWHALRTDH